VHFPRRETQERLAQPKGPSRVAAHGTQGRHCSKCTSFLHGEHACRRNQTNSTNQERRQLSALETRAATASCCSRDSGILTGSLPRLSSVSSCGTPARPERPDTWKLSTFKISCIFAPQAPAVRPRHATLSLIHVGFRWLLPNSAQLKVASTSEDGELTSKRRRWRID